MRQTIQRTRASNAAAAIATGGLANLAFVALVAPLEAPLHPGLFASHLCLSLAAYGALAALCAGRWSDRVWAASAFLLPVAGAALPLAQHAFGLRGIAGLTGLVALVLFAWARLPRVPGAPLVATAVGGLLSNELGRVRQGVMGGQLVDGGDALVLALWLVGGIAVGTLSGRLPARLRVPPAAWSGALAAAAVGVGALISLADGRSSSVEVPATSGWGRRPPVVLVVLDTVRADHVPLYGYPRNTMPAFTEFGRRDGVVVRRAYANGAWSLPSHASLFTGLHPPRHGAHEPFEDDPRKPAGGGYRLPDAIPTLAEILAGAGYWTAGMSANFGPLSHLFGLDRGFQHYDAEPDPTQTLAALSPLRIPRLPSSPFASFAAFLERWPPFASCDFFLGVRYQRARLITDGALALVDAARDQPFFLFVNYMDAHSPYSPPREYRHRFPGVRWTLGLHGIDERRQRRVLRGDRPVSAEEFEHLRALYDGELAYLDAEFGRLLEGLRRHDRWSEMLLVITSDHGDAFGEHASLGHGVSLYEELIRVPLVLKPGSAPAPAAPGEEIPGPLESVDVFATILAHAGVAAPDEIDGIPWGRTRTSAHAWLYSKNPLGIPSDRFDRERRAVIHAGWKLIESTSGEVELFDLERDPGELRNLADAEPERRLALSALVDSTHSRVFGQGAVEDAEALERLRALGYVR